MDRWYRLDHAGKLFPAIADANNTSTYRISVMLTELIQEEQLQLAVDIVIKRFPTMAVKIDRGAYWEYFSENNERLLIGPEQNYPCFQINPDDNNGHMIRVLYYKKKISVEAFHALADGTGIIEFVKTLIYQYLLLIGKAIDDEGIILLPEGIPNSTETEDSFQKYYHPGKAIRGQQVKAYHIPGDMIIPNGNNVIHGILSAKALNDIAKQNGVTITAYLVTVLAYAIYMQTLRYTPDKANIVVCVPVDLRNLFPSRTLRNFFAVENIIIQVSSEDTFNDILLNVSTQMKEKTTKEYLDSEILANMKYEKTFALRLVPRFIKNMFIRYGYNFFGESKTTTTLSNLGRIVLPKDMAAFIENINAVLYPTDSCPINCTVCTVGDCLTITFSRKIIQGHIIEEFFRVLTNQCNLEVAVYSNEWGM